ncbi:MAG: hypothetical protein VX899_08465 [Myxococcota bacterium]|nr:hypothetical protein [Myxococcota bacterium]
MRLEDRSGRVPAALQRLCVELIQEGFAINDDVSRQTLLQVVFEDSPLEQYGAWIPSYQEHRAENQYTDVGLVVGVTATITINTRLIDPNLSPRTVLETLAHEYGHHYTLGHLSRGVGLPLSRQIGGKRLRVPPRFYRVRALDPSTYSGGTDDWYRCDAELLAEDYRVLSAPADLARAHRMEDDLPAPGPEVEDFLRGLPSWGA